MKFLESIVNMKLNTIKRSDLLQLASHHGLALTNAEADQIVLEIRGKNYNIFNERQRKTVVKKITAIVGPERANHIEQLFLALTGR